MKIHTVLTRVRSWRIDRLYLASAIILASFAAAEADVPPDSGYKRVSIKLVVEAAEDFPDYRFFIKSGSDLEEIAIKKGDRRSIEPLGGGAWYRAGTFLAVPKKSLANLSEADTGEKLNELKKAVYDGKAADTIELVKHDFIRDVREAEASGVREAVYKIENDEASILKATLVSAADTETRGDADSGLTIYSNDMKTPLFWVTVIGGSLMTLAFIGLGVWFVRRSNGSRVS